VSAAAQAEASAEEPEVELAPTHEEAVAAKVGSAEAGADVAQTAEEAPVEEAPPAEEPSPEAIAADVSAEEE
jgi:hypothetical protein